MNLAQRDQKCIWHPFTQHYTAEDPIVITHAKGASLFDEHNKEYLDLVSSWWVNIHGHTHPYIAQAIAKQAQQLEHVMFAGFTHAPAINLAESLLKIAPAYHKVFFYRQWLYSHRSCLKNGLPILAKQGTKSS